MKDKHTSTPWRVAVGGGDIIIADRVEAVATTHGDNFKENTIRIVACVNACAGIPTIDLIDITKGSGGINWVMVGSMLGKQNKELLAVVKGMLESFDILTDGSTKLPIDPASIDCVKHAFLDEPTRARAIIAAIEGTKP